MKTWREPVPVEIPDALQRYVGGRPLVAGTLVRRGIRTVEAARGFLDPSQYTPAPALELPGMGRAVERIGRALESGEMICVWGDFDVDGQTSTTLLVETLQSLGADVFHHIPNRRRESHGLNLPFFEDVIGRGARLIVTCDTGIAGHEAIAYARECGVDVVVTDHHSLPERLPEAYALVNPGMLPPGHPLRDLPGVGVAYKLAEALYAAHSHAEPDAAAGAEGKIMRGAERAAGRLDLVALGIVADLAVQAGDTRYLLQRGLEALRGTRRAGLRALYEAAGIDSANLNEETIAFAVAPRMNALGRLSDANPIVDFLTTDDLAAAKVFAGRLEGLNAERKRITEGIFQGALAQLDRNPELERGAALVVAQQNWHPGVIGIVAARLVERYRKPALVIALGEDGAGRGSARSVAGVDITQAIAQCRSFLKTYGGHPMAAGLSLEAANIEPFRRALSRTVREMRAGAPLEPDLTIDAFISLSEIGIDLLADLERLGPFGAGNPPLILASRGLVVRGREKIGRGKEHQRLVVADDEGNVQPVIWWRSGEKTAPEGRFDLAYRLQVNDFKGRRDVQLIWIDARPVEAPDGERPRPPGIEVLDYRRDPDPEKTLQGLAAAGDLLVWGREEPGEGAARRLAIWTVPPDGAALAALLAEVQPEQVYLFGNAPRDVSAEAFLQNLAGLVKYTLRAYEGRAAAARLVESIGQSEPTIRAGLDWLAARGMCRWKRVKEDIVLEAGEGIGSGDPDSAAARVQAGLAETAAYRRYYLRAGAEQMIRGAMKPL